MYLKDKVTVGKFVLSSVRSEWIIVLSLTAVSSLVALLELSFLWISKAVVDVLTAENDLEPSDIFQKSSFQIIFLILALSPAIVWAHSSLLNRSLHSKFPYKVIKSVHLYLLRADVRFFNEFSASEVAWRNLGSSSALKDLVIQIFDTFIKVVAFLIGSTLILAKVNGLFASIIVIYGACYVTILSSSLRKISRLSSADSVQQGALVSRLSEFYENIATVLTYSSRQFQRDAIHRDLASCTNASMHLWNRFTYLRVSLWLLDIALIVAALIICVHEYISGNISVGDTILCIGAAFRLNGISQWIMWEGASFCIRLGTIDSGITMLERASPNIVQSACSNLSARVTEDCPLIEFHNVSFSFPGQPDILQNLNFSASNGARIAVVGPSGVGKSTLMLILIGMLRPAKGDIYCLGQPIEDMQEEVLYSLFSYVPQKANIFSSSIAENIAYGVERPEMGRVKTAATLAMADEFISKFTFGYETVVQNSGKQLSGGQMQRIALARALYKSSRIMVLDEPTSAVDTVNEARIFANILKAGSADVVFCATHKPSVAKDFESVIFIKGPGSVLAGTQAEIYRNDADYRTWFHSEKLPVSSC